MLNRRGFLGALAAIVAAPVAVVKALTSSQPDETTIEVDPDTAFRWERANDARPLLHKLLDRPTQQAPEDYDLFEDEDVGAYRKAKRDIGPYETTIFLDLGASQEAPFKRGEAVYCARTGEMMRVTGWSHGFGPTVLRACGGTPRRAILKGDWLLNAGEFG